MALTIVCSGYVTRDGQFVPCGRKLGTKPSPHDGETHTFCRECYQRHLEEQGAMGAAE